MIRPLNPALPSGMARLPNEILVEIVRHAVTADNILRIDEIPLSHFQLVSPFHRLSKLAEVAEDEMMRVNTFSMDLNRVPTLHRAADDIQHLQIHLELRLAGGRFASVDDIFGVDSSKLFALLDFVFPKLKTLDVQIKNYGNDRGGGRRRGAPELIQYADAFVLHTPTCDHFHSYRRTEHMLQMQKMLMAVGAVRTPKLTRKSVTFNQSCHQQFRPPPPVIGDNGFGSAAVLPFVKPRDHPSAAHKARAGLLFCELRRYPKSWIEAGIEHPRVAEHFSREELEMVYASEVGKQDREYLKSILRSPVVVVQMPCGR